MLRAEQDARRPAASRAAKLWARRFGCVKAASRAGRVLFIRDGEVYHQVYRGAMSDEQLYQKISDTLTMLATGGDRR